MLWISLVLGLSIVMFVLERFSVFLLIFCLLKVLGFSCKLKFGMVLIVILIGLRISFNIYMSRMGLVVLVFFNIFVVVIVCW